MTLPPNDSSFTSFQAAVLWVRFTGVLARSPVSLTVLCDLIQEIMRASDLGAIVMQEGLNVLLAVEGPEDDIDTLLRTVKSSRYVDVVVVCRSGVPEPRYRLGLLVQPVLTASERAWIRMEIGAGFTDPETLPTLVEWLALRQVEPRPSLQTHGLVHKAVRVGERSCADILLFRQR